MVFVIQNSANRSAKATQLKLDEIIRAIEGARNEFISLDKATDSVLEAHEQEFDRLTQDGTLDPPSTAESLSDRATSARTTTAKEADEMPMSAGR
jgi:low affinity Fe/Cu permease